MHSILSQIDFNKTMYAHFLDPQFTDKKQTFQSPRNYAAAQQFNNQFFLKADLNRSPNDKENLK
jgi:hypothetical protein